MNTVQALKTSRMRLLITHYQENFRSATTSYGSRFEKDMLEAEPEVLMLIFPLFSRESRNLDSLL